MNSEPKLQDAVFMSDLVVREAGTGKISLIGCFTSFTSLSFPFQTPAFFTTFYVTNLRGKVGTLPITLRIEKPGTGHVYASVSGSVGFPDRDLKDTESFEVSVQVPSFSINEAGDYQILVLISNEQIGRKFFKVRPLTSSTGVE